MKSRHTISFIISIFDTIYAIVELFPVVFSIFYLHCHAANLRRNERKENDVIIYRKEIERLSELLLHSREDIPSA